MTLQSEAAATPFPIHPTFVGLKRGHARVRDSQKQRLYDWEKRMFPSGLQLNLTLDQCTELATQVYRDHGVRAPIIGDGRRRRSACYVPGLHQIRLPRWSRYRAVVLHECAHGLTPSNEASHGPRFCYVFSYLLWRYPGRNAIDHRQSMVDYGLKVEGANA